MEIISIDGESIKPNLILPDLTPDTERDEEIKREREKKRQNEVLELIKATGMPERYYFETFDTFNGDIKAKVMEYAKSCKNYIGALVILGGSGTGKTHLACSCLRENTNGVYITMPTLEIELDCSRDFSAKENKIAVLKKYITPNLLVMDEIGRFQNALNERQAIYYIINERYNRMLNTILISNLTAKEFGDYIGNATADRLSEKRVLVEIHGESYRKIKGGRN